MIAVFRAGASGSFSSQPDSGGERLVVRSDDATDTATATAYGLVSSSPANEAETLDGKVEQYTVSAFESLTRFSLSAAATGTVSVFAAGTAASGDITVSTQPANNDTVLVGLNGKTTTYTFKTTMTPSDGEVLIGSTTAETADNLASAINDASTGTSIPVDGTDWQMGGTAPAGANAYVTATSTSSVVTLTDTVPCNRLLGWDVSQGTGSTLTIREPIGGADGTLLAVFTPGDTDIYTEVTLETEDLSTATVPGSMAFTSEWQLIDGRKWTVELRSDQNSTQFSSASLELANANSGSPEILVTHSLTLTGNPMDMVINNDTESGNDIRCQFIRLKITNGQTTDQALHAAVVWG